MADGDKAVVVPVIEIDKAHRGAVFARFPVFADTAINVGYPVTIGGQSKKSNSSVRYGDQGVKIQKEFLSEYGGYAIHESLFPAIDLRINLFPDSILVAVGMFPKLYGNMKFNYSAMWAYLIRIGKYFRWTLNPIGVMKMARQINEYHDFKIVKFIYYYALNMVADLARNTIFKTRTRKKTPSNIRDFAIQLSRRKSGCL